MEEIEKLRKAVILKILLVLVIGIIIIIGLISFFNKSLLANIVNIEDFLYLALSIVVLLIVIILIKKVKKDYCTKVKDSILINILNKHLNDVQYKEKGNISQEEIDRINKLFKVKVFAKGINYVEGKYKDVSFKMNDMIIKELDKAGGDSDPVRFMGTWIVFDFGKKVSFNFQIWEKKLKRLRNSFYPEIILQGFSDKYDVFCEKNITDDMIGKLEKINKEYEKGILVDCAQNTFRIGIRKSEASYSISLFKKFDLNEYEKKCYESIEPIIKIVDILK